MSFTDAYIIYIAKNYGFEYVASYDERSFSGIIRVIGRGYTKTIPEEELERIIKMMQMFK